MAKTLGKRLDAVQTAMDLALSGQSYKIADRELQRIPYSLLQKQEADLLKKIEVHGRDYIPGQNSQPVVMNVPIRFS